MPLSRRAARGGRPVHLGASVPHPRPPGAAPWHIAARLARDWTSFAVSTSRAAAVAPVSLAVRGSAATDALHPGAKSNLYAVYAHGPQTSEWLQRGDSAFDTLRSQGGSDSRLRILRGTWCTEPQTRQTSSRVRVHYALHTARECSRGGHVCSRCRWVRISIWYMREYHR